MANKLFWIHANLTAEQRSMLLAAYPPAHDNVWCRHMVWAYNVPENYNNFPAKPTTLVVIGRHSGPDHEALVCNLRDGPVTHGKRPDGGVIHITLSTADGVQPARGGDIKDENVAPGERLELPIELKHDHARQLPRERRAGA